MSAEELRIWIVIRRDLDMSAGKMAVQAGHAIASLILGAASRTPRAMLDEYMADNQPKIAVSVDSERDLKRAVDEAEKHLILTSLIQDAGRTEFSEPTFTAAAIGPCLRSQLPSFVRRLQLYRAPSSAGSEHRVPNPEVTGSSPVERTNV